MDTFKIQINHSVVLQTSDSFFCFKIIAAKVKIHQFKINLLDFVGLHYNVHYVYTNDKIQQITNSDLSSFELGNGENKNISGKGLEEYILSEIAKNNESFLERSEYSQYKYLKRKRPKLCLDIILLRPTIPLIWKVMNIRCSNKICYLSFQDLARLTQLQNITSDDDKKVMIFETCQGLITSTILNQMYGRGKIVQVYHGDFPNRTCTDNLGFKPFVLQNLCSINYDKLKSFKSNVADKANEMWFTNGSMDSNSQLKENTAKRYHEEIVALKILFNYDNEHRFEDVSFEPSMDALIIASKFHPKDIALNLLPFLKWSRPLVIYSQYRELLMECYASLKRTKSLINMEISETILQHHQVLPGRTHPFINMDGHNGFILSAIHVDPGILSHGMESGSEGE